MYKENVASSLSFICAVLLKNMLSFKAIVSIIFDLETRSKSEESIVKISSNNSFI